MMSKLSNINVNTKLHELFVNSAEGLNATCCAFVNDMRSDAIERFMSYGLPTLRDEDYKYSDITSWFEQVLEADYAVCTTPREVVFKQYANGVVVSDINTFAKNFKDIFEAHYTKSVEDNTLMMLSRAFAQGGTVVYVPRNIIANEVITLSFTSSCASLSLGERNMIILERGSLAKLHIEHGAQAVHNAVTEIFVADGANLELSEDYSYSGGVNIHTLSANLGRSAFYKHVSVNMSAGNTRVTEYVSLLGAGAEASIQGAVMSRGEAHIDNYTLIKHQVANCNSFEQFKCVASDSSVSAFNGNIYVAAGAGKTEAYQQNNNILLSDSAKIYSKPNLEIYADDVKCSHGATVGQLDENALFYMQQRGVALPEARGLMIKGFMMDIVSKISSSDIVDKLREKVDNV